MIVCLMEHQSSIKVYLEKILQLLSMKPKKGHRKGKLLILWQTSSVGMSNDTNRGSQVEVHVGTKVCTLRHTWKKWDLLYCIHSWLARLCTNSMYIFNFDLTDEGLKGGQYTTYGQFIPIFLEGPSCLDQGPRSNMSIL